MDVASVTQTGPVLPAVPDSSPNWLAENRELIQSVKSIDASGLFGEGSELSFTMDQETKQPVVRVIDRETHEVLWQAPPEYLLRVAEFLSAPDGSHA